MNEKDVKVEQIIKIIKKLFSIKSLYDWIEKCM